MTFFEPWYATDDNGLLAELRRELPSGHMLSGKELLVLARRQDRDDVLFKLRDGSERLAQVHLTYAKEHDPRWPRTTIFPTEQAWLEAMRADHADYGA